TVKVGFDERRPNVLYALAQGRDSEDKHYTYELARWDTATGAKTQPYSSDGNEDVSDFSADSGRILIKTAKGFLQIRDLGTGKPLLPEPWRLPNIVRAWLTPGGAFIVAATRDELWQRPVAPDSKPEWLLAGGLVEHIACDRANRYLVAAANDGIKLWHRA